MLPVFSSTTERHCTCLVTAFRIPETVMLANRCQFTGLEILLFSLHRYSTAMRMEDAANLIFGRDNTQWSRAFSWFNNHMITNFAKLLISNFDYWIPHLSYCARMTRNCGSQHMELWPSVQAPSEFVRSSTVMYQKMTRPGGGGPMPGQPRFDLLLQEAFYNGWKHHHGIKWQLVELPVGMCMDLFGPKSFKRHDIQVYRDSKLHSSY